MNEMSLRFLRHAQGSFGPLGMNAAHQFAADHALSLYARNAVFTFIPKNGCTSLRYSAALDNQVIDGPDNLEWIHKNNPSFRPTLRELRTADYTSVVLRCPFRRLVSCFLHWIVEGHSQASQLQAHALAHRMRLTGRIGEWLRKHLRGSFTASPALLGSITFADFVAMLETPGALLLDVHWRPQVDFLVYQSYDDVFCLEDTDNFIATLQAKVGFAVHDTRAITNHGNHERDRIRDGFFGRTGTRALRKLKTEMKVPAYERFFDADLYQRVSCLYQADIELYARQFGQSALMQLP